jgi:hypothetical protein
MPSDPNELSNPATAPEPENYGLPANFVPIDVPPIIPSNGPSSGVNPFGGGSIPQNMSLQPDFVNTLYRGGAVPTVRLMPVQGAPSTNAQSESVAQKVVSEVINSTTNSSGQFVSLETNGVLNAEQDILNVQNGVNTTAVYAGAGAVQINTSAHELAVNGTAAPGIEVNLNSSTPAPVTNTTNVIFQSDGGTPETNVSAYMPLMVGDSGSGGTSGAVPAPPSGSFAAGKYLTAGGTYAVPPGTGGAAYYQTVQEAGSPVTQQPVLNFLAPFVVTNNSGNTSSDISASFPGISAFTNQDLASTVSLTGGSAAIVDSIAVTFPSSGGPWHARVSYFYSMSGGVDWVAGAYDGSIRFAGSQGTTHSSIAGAGASGLSPSTYANSATITFSVVIINSGNATVETSASGAGLGVPSYMQVEVISS